MNSLEKILCLLSAAALVFLLGCDNPAAPVPTEGLIKISIKSLSVPTSQSLRKLAGAATITNARIVIAEIEFENSVRDSVDFELEDPFVQNLAVDTSLHEIATVQVPFGSYKEMEVQIDELKARDSTAYQQNPQLQNLSIRVEGFLDDVVTDTFVFTSDVSAAQEREFKPPLVIDENSPTSNVVLTIDMGMWFVDEDGKLLDPRREQNRRAIEKNIKASFDVFEDEDDDGKRDGDDD